MPISTMASSRPQILFIDAYDSFTNNIVSLLTTLLTVDVTIITIDDTLGASDDVERERTFRSALSRYDAVVCGPGPGSPDNDCDVGLMKLLWALPEAELLPVLGICLGFQSLSCAFGASIRRLRGGGLHGMVRRIDHLGRDAEDGDIFNGVSPFRATLYHSLCVDLGQDAIPEDEWPGLRWRPLRGCPDLVPLAWHEEPVANSSRSENERICMAVKHRQRPFWGLQYHPESVCTEPSGDQVIKNWFWQAMRWNSLHRPSSETGRGGPDPASNLVGRDPVKESHLSALSRLQSKLLSSPNPPTNWTAMDGLSQFGLDSHLVQRVINLPPGVEIPDIVEALYGSGIGDREHIILDSANAAASVGARDVRGRYSVIGVDVSRALRFEYRASANAVDVRLPSFGSSSPEVTERVSFDWHENIWQFLGDFLERRHAEHPTGEGADVPFIGGFMGYVTYELGLDEIGVEVTPKRTHTRPDLCFAWVHRSIVVDHVAGRVYIQQLEPRDDSEAAWRKSLRTTRDEGCRWVEKTISALQTSATWHSNASHYLGLENTNGANEFGNGDGYPAAPANILAKAKTNGNGHAVRAPSKVISPTPRLEVKTPDPATYEAQVIASQQLIQAGESYELCLTDQTTIRVPNPPPNLSWTLFKTLRKRQPAPFASYIRLSGATLVSSSPERFLSLDRKNQCSMRPMKGTVRKGVDGIVTLAQAEAALRIPKEEAENLMIVDLVRHDLHGVCGPGQVQVPHLLKVEEYATVFQMITIVEGHLPPQTPHPSPLPYKPHPTVLDVLSASLPPGSMTGAPKKRSCELLRSLERRTERGLYAGVVGYLDVTGRSDWSVTIRSLYRWDDEREENGDLCETWRIGAGGAVTALSSAEGERDEMDAKLCGPLGVFKEVYEMV